MEPAVKTLNEVYNELMIYSPSTSPYNKYRFLYHYTSNEAKQFIADEEKKTIEFKLTRASKFLDKNEGIYIFEPFLHACGYLYNNSFIDQSFYQVLKKINRDDIVKNDDPWILCLSSEGNSIFMKERYAPGEGWLIILQADLFDELEIEYEDEMNIIRLEEVIYSYKQMKQQLQDAILLLYNSYVNDKSIDINEKDRFVKNTMIDYLSMYNFSYKNESYKNENELRLVCYIKKPFDEWINPANIDMSLYFKEDELYLGLKHSCYYAVTQAINPFYCRRLNKKILSEPEINKTLKQAIE